MLVSLAEASDHVRRDTDADDADLTLKIEGASGAVINYLKQPDFIGADGNVVGTVPNEVKSATLLLIGEMYNARDAEAYQRWTQQGYLPPPVVSLLYPLRKPALA